MSTVAASFWMTCIFRWYLAGSLPRVERRPRQFQLARRSGIARSSPVRAARSASQQVEGEGDAEVVVAVGVDEGGAEAEVGGEAVADADVVSGS